jgi:hypothetical protein
VRSLETQEARPLERAGGLPFWSADSRYIVFSWQGKVRKIDGVGGPAQLLADVQSPIVGGFSTPDDRLVFADFTGGAKQVPSAGGIPAAC